ncbi:MAG: HYR domain-containing protein, partial [Saprospiraceae bacterium]|nr:HYR domain-containing protein [Saprospiraceae bacterium]
MNCNLYTAVFNTEFSHRVGRTLLSGFVMTLAMLFPAFTAEAQVSITTACGTLYSQDFDAYLGTSATVPAGWSSSVSAAQYQGTGTGTGTAGGAWAYGSGGEYSFGSLRSGSTGNITSSVSFVNNTGGTINQLVISYDFEQWRYANTSGFTVTGTGALGAVSLSGLDQNGVAVGTNGTVSVTSKSLTVTIPGGIADGVAFGIQWVTTDVTGADNGIAIDNFSIAAPPPTLTLTASAPSTATCGDIIDVEIKVNSSFTAISSLQYSVEWDETKLMYVSSNGLEIGGIGGDPIIGDGDALTLGELIYVWFDPSGFDGEDLADNITILTLTMKVLESTGSATVSVTDNPQPREVVDANFCSNTVSSVNASISLNPISVTCPSPLSVCYNDSPFLLTDGTPAGGLHSGAGVAANNFTASSAGLGAHIITYSYTDGNGCSNSCTYTITVNANPAPSVSGTASVCAGSMTQLTGTPGVVLPATLQSESWMSSANGVATVDNTGKVTGVSSGMATITYTVTDNNGCSSNSSVVVTVNAQPTASIAPDPAFTCVGDDLPLDGNPGGGSGTYTTHAWTGAGATSLDFTNIQTPTFNNATPGMYALTYTVTDDNGCMGSDDITVTVGGGKTLKLTAEGPAGPLTCGELFDVTVKVTDFTDIGSLDFSVNWDASEVSLQSDVPAVIEGDAPVTGTPMADQYTFTWFDTDFPGYGATLADGTTILTLSFKAVADMASGVNVDITGTPTALNASDNNFCLVTVTPMNMVDFDINKIAVTCPSNITVCVAEPAFTLPDGTPAGGSFSGAGVSGDQFDPAVATAGTHDITYSYTDGNGCSNSCIFQVIVNEQLTISPISDINVCPGAMISAIPLSAVPASNSTVFSWTGGAAVGLVDGNDTGANPEIPGFTASAAITSALVNVTAAFGACMDDVSFTITLEDNVDPQITDCPDNLDLEGCSTAAITGLTYSETDVPVNAADFAGVGGVATDNCGAAFLTYKYKDTKSGSCPIVVSRKWTVTDLAGRTAVCTQTINIDDTQKPVIATCPKTRNIEGCNTDAISGPSYSESTTNSSYGVFSNATNGGAASDVCGIVSVKYRDSKTGSCPTVVSRKWTVTDACNNSTDCIQTINVDDTANPDANCKDAAIVIGNDGTATLTPAHINDNSFDECGIKNMSVSQSLFDCHHIGENTVTLTVRDKCDNISTCEATVTVDQGNYLQMTQLPDMYICPGTNVEAIELSGLPLDKVINYQWSGGAPTGMANGNATGADPEIPAFVAADDEGSWVVSVTANIFNCVDYDEFTITINDANAPHFINCPTDMIVNNDPDKCGANVNWYQPIAMDGCVGITEIGVYQVTPPGKEPGSFFPVGEHTIKYIADDDNGNTTSCVFKIKVRDMQLPDIECPSGIQYLETNNGQCSHTLSGTYLNASVVENCGLDYVRNDYTNASTLNGAVFPAGSYP